MYENYNLEDKEHTLVITTKEKANKTDDICIAVLDFMDLSEYPVFYRFSFEPYTVSKIKENSAFARAKLVAKGSKKINKIGFVCSQNGVPSISDIKTIAFLEENGDFCANIENLNSFTNYNCRAYALVDEVVYYAHESFRFTAVYQNKYLF